MRRRQFCRKPSTAFMTYSMLGLYVTQEQREFTMRVLALIAAAVIGITAIQPADAMRPREREQGKA